MDQQASLAASAPLKLHVMPQKACLLDIL